MKKYLNYIFLLAFVALLASCDCKTCTKESEVSIQICRGDVSETEYNDAIAAQEANGYTCK